MKLASQELSIVFLFLLYLCAWICAKSILELGALFCFDVGWLNTTGQSWRFLTPRPQKGRGRKHEEKCLMS